MFASKVKIYKSTLDPKHQSSLFLAFRTESQVPKILKHQSLPLSSPREKKSYQLIKFLDKSIRKKKDKATYGEEEELKQQYFLALICVCVERM